MHPHYHARVPSLGSTARVHVNPIDGYQCSNELRAQLNLTNDHQKKKAPYLQGCPVASTWFHVNGSTVEWRTLLRKVEKTVVVVASSYVDSVVKEKAMPRHSGHAVQHNDIDR